MMDSRSLDDPSVCILPGGTNKKEIRGLCEKFGLLVDIYLAGRRDASGSFFAFVRFANVGNLEVVVDALNRIYLRGNNFLANLAKHLRKQSSVGHSVSWRLLSRLFHLWVARILFIAGTIDLSLMS
ncbi:unnamed protein product [Lactuca virosa]|uniref:RRM domain-containing protein n=1 Tax=Lactuca virosa TaxID=75947 RepID=A0AAU9PLD1_9ASTR|nr:unnamed protein product [Lactuca virosa]